MSLQHLQVHPEAGFREQDHAGQGSLPPPSRPWLLLLHLHPCVGVLLHAPEAQTQRPHRPGGPPSDPPAGPLLPSGLVPLSAPPGHDGLARPGQVSSDPAVFIWQDVLGTSCLHKLFIWQDVL